MESPAETHPQLCDLTRSSAVNISQASYNVGEGPAAGSLFAELPMERIFVDGVVVSAPGDSLNGGHEPLSFGSGDVDNPVNWPFRKKILVVIIGIVTTINSTLGSALPSGTTTCIAIYFDVTIQAQLVLPISVYLIGYVLGPLAFGPLSETYGRRFITMLTFFGFTIFTMACALAPDWPSLLVFRLFTGICASSAISVTGGIYADIYNNPISRGRAMALFMAATTFGPALAPIISGFVSVVSWRWSFWVAFIFAGLSCILVMLLPETYGPIILKKRAQRLRKETGNSIIRAPIELEKKGAKQMATVTLTRPLRMIYSEAIVFFTCLYLSFGYAIFYLFFEAYPIIFQGIYGMNTGVSGLAFLPIAIGACFAATGFLLWDSRLQRAKKANAHWASVEEYRRLPLACFGGPLYIISLFWLGWAASPKVHWIVPMLAGLPFGIGFLLIFMAMLNYLTDAYQIYAASALAAASCCRSLFGAVLPLAGKPMYDALGVAWASSVLGFLSLGLTIIPFAFIRYGDRIRANSKFCQYIEEKSKQEQKNKGVREAQISAPITDMDITEKI